MLPLKFPYSSVKCPYSSVKMSLQFRHKDTLKCTIYNRLDITSDKEQQLNVNLQSVLRMHGVIMLQLKSCLLRVNLKEVSAQTSCRFPLMLAPMNGRPTNTYSQSRNMHAFVRLCEHGPECI